MIENDVHMVWVQKQVIIYLLDIYLSIC